MSAPEDSKMPDVAPGKTWEQCTVEQKINRLVGTLYQLSMQMEYLQETLITHDHVTVQKTPPLVNIKKKEPKK